MEELCRGRRSALGPTVDVNQGNKRSCMDVLKQSTDPLSSRYQNRGGGYGDLVVKGGATTSCNNCHGLGKA